jgi:small subunit ribosomal protein S20
MAKLKTGRHTSALKAHRKSLQRAVANVQVRSRIRTIARNVEKAVAEKNAEAARAYLNEAFSLWDKAAKSGVVHWRAAARKKSRLASRVGTLQAAKA